MSQGTESFFSVRALKTAIFHPKDDLAEFILREVPLGTLKEGDILAVTSKIVALAEGAVVSKGETAKANLVKREADVYLGETAFQVALTIKHGLLVPSAGIDESNAEDDYFILYPHDPFASARLLHQKLSEKLGFSKFGILLTDSHTQPLRRGVIGLGLACWGFKPVRSRVGTPDLFGRPLRMTHINHLDALAVSAVWVMGEANESTPLALIRGAAVEFCDEVRPEDVQIPLKEDLYLPLFSHLLKQDE